jgi:hypothetical protein
MRAPPFLPDSGSPVIEPPNQKIFLLDPILQKWMVDNGRWFIVQVLIPAFRVRDFPGLLSNK